MARLIAALMRHGIYHQPEGVPSAHLPHPLTTEGSLQAEAAARELQERAKREGWSIHSPIHCSRLLRAWQTARIVAQQMQASTHGDFAVEEFEDLAERSVGSAANLTIEQIEEVIRSDPRSEPLAPDWKATSAFRLPLPGAESLLQSGERVAAHLNRTMDELSSLPEDTLQIFVGHGGSIRHAAVHLDLLSLEEVIELSMHHCRPLYWERLDDGSWVHLSGEWKKRDSPKQRSD